MDDTIHSQELLDNVDIVPVENFRSEVVKLNSGDNAMKCSEGVEPQSELISAQYININRVTDSLSKELTDCASPTPTGIMSGELIQQHIVHSGLVVDLMVPQGPPPTDYSQHHLDRATLPQYISEHYETTDDLLPQDLTEEDRRLAAALVAVQLVQQQKQQHHQQHHTIVTSESNVIVSPGGTPRLIGSVGHLVNKIPVSLSDHHQITSLQPMSPVDKPAMSAMVSSYIQAVEEAVAANHHPHLSQGERVVKMYQPQPQHQELRLPTLPPLKKMVSNHALGIRNQYLREPHVQDTSKVDVGVHSQLRRQSSHVRSQEVIKEEGVGLYRFEVKHEGLMYEDESDEAALDDNDSDYDVENDLKSSRRSLPHKKRIPRKLKNLKHSSSPSKSVPVKIFKCNKCGEQFETQLNLSSHKLTHSPAKKAFNCEICNKGFAHQLKFFEHLKSHYEPPPGNGVEPIVSKVQRDTNVIKETTPIQEEVNSVYCTLCGKVFRRQKALETHLALAHPKVEPMEEFSEPEDLMEGIRGVVDVGGAETGDEGDIEGLPLASRTLKMHDKDWYPEEELHAAEADLRELEQQQQENTCDICGEVFEDKYQVNLHVREVHLQLKEELIKEDEGAPKGRKRPRRPGVHLACPQCGRMFNHRNSLVYHMRSHSGERPHQCEVCGKSFFAASALKVHMRLHSGDKPYKCEFCGRHFRQWGDLKYHCISIHSEEKNYQCEYCGKDFARKYSLIVHRRIHTGEKNYKCEFCEKSFRASSYLQNHRRIHTGEKPHPCEICGKPFRVRSDMKRHLNTHNRDRPNSQDAPSTRNRQRANIETHLLHETKLEDDSDQLHQSLDQHSMDDLNPVEITIQHDGSGPESILPDESLGDPSGDSQPINLNIAVPTTVGSRQSHAQQLTAAAQVTEEVLHYTRDPLETVREGNSTVYVWPMIYMA